MLITQCILSLLASCEAEHTVQYMMDDLHILVSYTVSQGLGDFRSSAVVF